MRLIAPLPLRWVRAMGWAFGWLLYGIAASRRRIVRRNLSLCFPDQSDAERKALEPQIFVYFAQAWLDRSWLWYGSPILLGRRLHLCGDVAALRETPKLVLFAPHFFGLDAGALAITLSKFRELCFIYTPQANPVIDQWMLSRRQRFGGLHPFVRGTGALDITASVKSGVVLHLSPDMDFGSDHAEFIPFFGIPAATVTSLSRFARLSKSPVMTIANILTPQGYDVRLSGHWNDFPTSDAIADTARMNRELEALIREFPAQYYWVHKRLKTRPPGEPPIY